MSKTVKLAFTQDEIAMLADALEVDLDGYLEATKEARGNNNREDVKTFTEASERISELLNRLREHLDED